MVSELGAIQNTIAERLPLHQQACTKRISNGQCKPKLNAMGITMDVSTNSSVLLCARRALSAVMLEDSVRHSFWSVCLLHFTPDFFSVV